MQMPRQQSENYVSIALLESKEQQNEISIEFQMTGQWILCNIHQC